jgi:hypothetical protein
MGPPSFLPLALAAARAALVRSLMASGAALTRAAASSAGCLAARVEAARKDLKVFVFVEAIEAQFIEKRSDGRRDPGGGMRKPMR